MLLHYDFVEIKQILCISLCKVSIWLKKKQISTKNDNKPSEILYPKLNKQGIPRLQNRYLETDTYVDFIWNIRVNSICLLCIINACNLLQKIHKDPMCIPSVLVAVYMALIVTSSFPPFKISVVLDNCWKWWDICTARAINSKRTKTYVLNCISL